jgi:hypothetical protein
MVYKGLTKTVIIQSGRYGAVVTLSAYQTRGREFDPPLLHLKKELTTRLTELNRTYKERLIVKTYRYKLNGPEFNSKDLMEKWKET